MSAMSAPENGAAPGITQAYQVLDVTESPGLKSMPVYFRPSEPNDLNTIYGLEAASYPADEAATLEKMEYRMQHAPGAFLVAVTPCAPPADGSSSINEKIIGYTCGTCTCQPQLTHESMSTHEPDGTLLCVHSVVVDGRFRRTGIATRMLKAYIQYVQACLPGLQGLALLCKQDLIKLYEGAGFGLVGPSDVVHGQDLWYEMKLELVDE